MLGLFYPTIFVAFEIEKFRRKWVVNFIGVVMQFFLPSSQNSVALFVFRPRFYSIVICFLIFQIVSGYFMPVNLAAVISLSPRGDE